MLKFFIDLLQLTGRQEVNGVLKFSSVSAMDMAVESINTISVDSFVNTHSEQFLRDLKHFSTLTTNVIDVQGQTNGVSFRFIIDFLFWNILISTGRA